MTADEIIKIMEKFKELGLTKYECDGLTLESASPDPISVPARRPVPPMADEIKPEDIMAPLSVFDELDETELLYWSTPYWDELQKKKELQRKAKEDEVSSNKNT